jgi:hypothetical protein
VIFTSGSLSSISFSQGMHISVTGLSCPTIFTESADSRINRKMIDFFIGGNYKCITKVKGCSYRNQKKVKGLKKRNSLCWQAIVTFCADGKGKDR